MLTALAYLPPQFVLTAFETLKSQFSTEALAVYIYFQDTYVGKKDEHGLYPPLFPIPMWNDYHLVAYGQSIKRSLLLGARSRSALLTRKRSGALFSLLRLNWSVLSLPLLNNRSALIFALLCLFLIEHYLSPI